MLERVYFSEEKRQQTGNAANNRLVRACRGPAETRSGARGTCDQSGCSIARRLRIGGRVSTVIAVLEMISQAQAVAMESQISALVTTGRIEP